MNTNNPTNGIKKVQSFLGEPYEIKVIDMENVIYRRLGDDYDLEVSGLDNNRKTIDADVYVWRKIPGAEIIEIYNSIHSLIDLKDLLGSISLKHRNLDPEKPLFVKSR
ncbi:hypothetical protein [Clostridium merdae]|uniref:hypothetical protein n=1 Tax=Clostridium merdae TaxID=1958780 RepID=UPI00164E5B59|nr:hypothetical protein [Clostridium merdae]